MTKKTYNKLVRDKIPSIIEKSGRKAEFITITDFIKKRALLNKKLIEEVNEYSENREVEELIDIVEVVYALLNLENISIENFEKLREEKKQEKGGFWEGCLLVSVEEE